MNHIKQIIQSKVFYMTLTTVVSFVVGVQVFAVVATLILRALNAGREVDGQVADIAAYPLLAVCVWVGCRLGAVVHQMHYPSPTAPS